ncbi:hypothetical protein FNV43_RR14769 [Rhamnella rubrinervis]|uniref:VQ domain-containing protein n=1 Tax=Rhamnella rubrinervis TaxID=2594499 RepID=A0A8K0H3K3_9ROSA|nr:hypothetical protein FNV43_RR14769 [Rhamnella rubrinervis]
MNQTMSSSSEWMHFYNQNFSGQPSQLPLTHHLPSSGPILGSGNDRVSDATVVTTTSTATPLGSGNSSPTNHLSPDGRVSKPARKRSRASRRTPTTLLNTDTTNFRAMVQQFTGGPSAPFGSVSQPGGAGFGFGVVGGRPSYVNPAGAVMVPPGYQLHQQQQQVYGQQQSQQQAQYLQFALSNSGSNTPAVDGFLQRLSSGRPMGNNGGVAVATEGFLTNIEGGVSSQAVAARGSNSTNENRNSNNTSFMF